MLEASTSFEIREVRGRDDLWVAEVSVGNDQGPWNFGVSILEFRATRSRVSRSTSRRLGPTRAAGTVGGAP
jgi:hypothetical protein